MTQSNLFVQASAPSLAADAPMSSYARISACGRYRYTLWRRWADGPHLLFLMLNPSTADALDDDPTIRRCMDFAKSLGFSGLDVVNLFAWRSTSPDAMFDRLGIDDIIGPDNNDVIVDAARRTGMVIAAWGADRRAASRARDVRSILRPFCDVHCLATSRDDSPRHPLYLKKDLQPIIYQEMGVA